MFPRKHFLEIKLKRIYNILIIHYIIIALFDKCEPVVQCSKLGLVEDRVGPGVFLNEGPHKHLLTIFGAFNGFLKPMQRLAVIAYSQFCPYLDDRIDKPIPVYLLDLIVHLLCVFTLPQTSVAVCNVDVYGRSRIVRKQLISESHAAPKDLL